MAAADALPARYSFAARLLHWVTALLIVGLVATGVAMTRASLSIEATFALYQWHKSLGLLVAIVMLLRLFVRWRTPRPAQSLALAPARARLAGLVHRLLYGCLIVLPVLGWLATSAAPLQLPLMLFGIVDVPLLGILATLPEPRRMLWYGWLAALHGWLALMTGCLVLVHVAGGLQHGGSVMRRMSLWP
jgi:cytochrome b561